MFGVRGENVHMLRSAEEPSALWPPSVATPVGTQGVCTKTLPDEPPMSLTINLKILHGRSHEPGLLLRIEASPSTVTWNEQHSPDASTFPGATVCWRSCHLVPPLVSEFICSLHRWQLGPQLTTPHWWRTWWASSGWARMFEEVTCFYSREMHTILPA